jgi:MYXO-CTERM domain-containing protein
MCHAPPRPARPTALVALPAAAAAKEVSALDVCGADGCTRLTDRVALRAFEQGGDLAEAAPAGLQRSYVLRVHMRDQNGEHIPSWTNRWLPSAGLIASHGEAPGLTFTRVEPALERVLRRAARGHEARPARRYVRSPAPVARVDEVVPAPKASSSTDDGGSPTLAWAGFGALALLAVGGVRLRRR